MRQLSNDVDVSSYRINMSFLHIKMSAKLTIGSFIIVHNNHAIYELTKDNNSSSSFVKGQPDCFGKCWLQLFEV